jgi:RNA 3'-terminal phosphate cyclase (ATP)
MLEIDGSYGEGGGQLLRTAVALAAITGAAVTLTNVRARRANPGLAAQHLTAVSAVAALCDAEVGGLALKAQRVVFRPRRLRGGDFRFDIGTAGSITLVLQALLPAMIHGGERVRVSISGGTDVRAAPPVDYFEHVLLPLLGRMGAWVRCELRRRGYYPRGGGEVAVAVEPGTLHAVQLEHAGAQTTLQGNAHVANLPAHVAERMRSAAIGPLRRFGFSESAVATRVLGNDAAYGPGGAIVPWAQTARTVLGAGRVAQRGVRAEQLGKDAGNELAADIGAGVSLDVHASDQLLVYLALAGGQSRFTTRIMSSHAQTTIWLIEQFLPVRFETASCRGGVSIAVRSA